MSIYSKYLISVGCIGLIGTPIFILDFNNLGWQVNKEIYWGMIALIAMIGALLFDNTAKKIQKKIEDEEAREADNPNN